MSETRRLWDQWSEAFQEAWNAETGESERRPAPIHYGPGFPEDRRLAFLPDLEGAAVVELGCGGGQASVGFARRETGRVVGVDFSREQLDAARGLRDEYAVTAEFVGGDVSALPLAADSFDLAFSSWVYHMVEDLNVAFREASRVLRGGGSFVFAMPHPFYELFDPAAGELERSYFDSSPVRKSIGDLEPSLVEYQRGVGEIHEALREAGFEVEQLYEPGSMDPDAYREQWSHKPELMAQVPPTLVFRAVAE